MIGSVYLKTLYERRGFLIGWTLGFMALAMLMVAFFPAMNQDGAIDALVENMPKAFEGLIGNLADLRTFPSYLASQLFDIRLPLIAGIMAIILGFGLSTSEEESGELRTLLALPISRTSLLMQKWLALVTIMAVSIVGLFAGVYLTAPFVDGASIELSDMVKLSAMTLLLMTAFGTITFAAGMIFGRKGVANLIGVVVIMGSFILTTFGQAVDWLEPYEKISLLHYFPAVDIVKGAFELSNIAVLGGLSAALLLLSIIVFRRRDIGG